ncbi:DMT family transporter [Streptomyces himalayensis]|uniref:DMT family transporter n=1 Tax=Streptomyces himalayensis subsp. himalayensis TaxID=2756131 RepID=A0A7W0ICD7_9ACTN|nr:DMT family transporter [Streptomyces himalayensis]MBA2950418.1 DMT family transporter [Streptomyces himalayensis subsp. himalayensis]
MNAAVAVLAALLSAMSFGVGSVVQQQAAREAPARESLRLRLLLDLARRPKWLAGMGLTISSYVLLGLALAFGPLILVQPLAATDLVFALPLLAWRRSMPLTHREAIGIACTAGGVAMFLTVLPVPAETAVPEVADWLPVLVAIGGAVALLVPIGVRNRGRTRTAMYAISAALLFALLDSLTKSAAGRFRADGVGAFSHWEPYSLILIGVLGLILSQSSYQAGSLAISLPIIDTLEPIGAVAIGVALFGDQLASSTWAVTVQALGAAIAVAGIVFLDSSPLARA